MPRKNYKAALNTLEEYCKKKRWEIVIKHNLEDVADFETKVILVGKRKKIAICVFLLLHEIGHLMLYNHTPNYDQKFNPTTTSKNVSKISQVAEEFLAWERGEKLALKLGLDIDWEYFDRIKSRCLISYAKWACGYYSLEEKLKKLKKEKETACSTT